MVLKIVFTKAARVQSQKCRIVIVDDHAPFRQAVRNLLSLHDDLQVIGKPPMGERQSKWWRMSAGCNSDGNQNAQNERR